MNSIDETVLVNKLMPETWVCPHCGKKHVKNPYADGILMENFKYIEHCGNCCYLHLWTLKLTDDFKRSVVEMLLKG